MAGQDSRQFQLSDYLIIFLSILFGYAVSLFFSGWGALIKHSAYVKIYWVHLGWTILIFLDLIEVWWGLWPRREKLGKHIGYFFLALSYPIMYYLLAIIIFPDISNGQIIILKDYFYSNLTLIFSLLAFAMLFSVICNSIWVGKPVLKEFALQAILGVVVAIGIFLRFEWYHIIIFSAAAMSWVLWVIRYRTRLKQPDN